MKVGDKIRLVKETEFYDEYGYTFYGNIGEERIIVEFIYVDNGVYMRLDDDASCLFKVDDCWEVITDWSWKINSIHNDRDYIYVKVLKQYIKDDLIAKGYTSYSKLDEDIQEILDRRFGF